MSDLPNVEPNTLKSGVPAEGPFAPGGKYDPVAFNDALIEILALSATDTGKATVNGKTVQLSQKVPNLNSLLNDLQNVGAKITFFESSDGVAQTHFSAFGIPTTVSVFGKPTKVEVFVPNVPNIQDRSTIAAAALVAEMSGAAAPEGTAPVDRERLTNGNFWAILNKLNLGDLRLFKSADDGTPISANEAILKGDKFLQRTAENAFAQSYAGPQGAKDIMSVNRFASDFIAQQFKEIDDLRANIRNTAKAVGDAVQKTFVKSTLAAYQAALSGEISRSEAERAVVNATIIGSEVAKAVKANAEISIDELISTVKQKVDQKLVNESTSQKALDKKDNAVAGAVKAVQHFVTLSEFMRNQAKSKDPNLGLKAVQGTLKTLESIREIVDSDDLSSASLKRITKDGGKELGEVLKGGAANAVPVEKLGSLPINQGQSNQQARTGYPRSADIFWRQVWIQISEKVKGIRPKIDIAAINKAEKQQTQHEVYLKKLEELKKQQELLAQQQRQQQQQQPVPVLTWDPRSGLPILTWIMPGPFAFGSGFGYGFWGVLTPAGEWRATGKILHPLVLDLDDDGIETTSLEEGIFFDHDLDGTAELSAWVGADDGLLVWDKNKNGIIDDANELFGDFTIGKNFGPAGDGFNALKDLNINSDSKIDKDDAHFSDLAVLDGIGVLHSLEELHIESLTFVADDVPPAEQADENGNKKVKTSTYTTAIENKKGKIQREEHELADVGFQREPSISRVTEEIAVPEDVAALPDVPGFALPNLHQAIMRDATLELKSLVQDYVDATDPVARAALVDQIVYKWAGVNLPQTPGAYPEPTHAVVIQKFSGLDSSNAPVELVEATYFASKQWTSAQLAFQGHLSEFAEWFDDPDSLPDNIDEFFELARVAIDDLLENNPEEPEFGKNMLYEFVSAVRAVGLDWAAGFEELTEHFSSLGSEFQAIIESAGRLPTNLLGSDSFDVTGSAVRLIPQAVFGGDGDNSIVTGAGNDFVSGADGDDVVYGMEGNDALEGNDGSDVLYGDDGNDVLRGGEGDDSLHGGLGADAIAGGSGSDSLYGGFGDDTYVFNIGDGQDVIDEVPGSEDDFDTIRFGPGISQSALTFEPDSDNPSDLLITVGTGGDQIKITGQFDQASNALRVEKLVFDDGTELDQRALNLGTGIHGSTSADLDLDGTGADDSIYALSGDDNVSAGGGHDFVLAGTGDDTVSGEGGDDTIWGEEGNDTISGGDGDDYIVGGKGDDTVSGGEGADFYVYGPQDGSDTISDIGDVSDAADTVRFTGIKLEELFLYTIDGQDLIIGRNGSDNTLTLVDQLGSDSLRHIEEFTFDELDPLIEPDNTMTAQKLMEELKVARWGTAGNDTIAAGDDTHTIWGQQGNDSLTGGADDDRYLFDLGDGADTITENTMAQQDSTDTIEFGAGVSSSDLVFSATPAGDLEIQYSESGDEITVLGHFGSEVSKRIEKIVFADGSELEHTEILSLLQLNGTEGADTPDATFLGEQVNTGAGNDTINAGGGDDTVDAGDGDDFVDGGEGNDTLIGGQGNDSLAGGSGTDSYVFNLGDGQDVIDQTSAVSNDQDSIRMGSGIVFADVSLLRPGQGNDLLITVGSGGDSILISNHFATDVGKRVQRIILDDASVISISDPVLPGGGTLGNDKITGTAASEIINSYGGADKVWGEDGNDLVSGGSGKDNLKGSIGDDVLDGGADDDSLYGEDGNDALIGGDGNDVLSGGRGDDLLLGGAGNESMSGEEGADALVGGLGDDKLSGGDGDDTLDGGEGNDSLTAGAGADTLVGGSGADTLSGGTGDDTLTGGTDKDTLLGDDGNDELDGGDGEDELTGGAGDDILVGGAEQDVMSGGTGKDIYVYNLGDGSDILRESGSGENDLDDAIHFGPGISMLDLDLRRDPRTNDLIIAIAGQSDTIRVRDHFRSAQIENFVFDDGSVVPLDLFGQWSALHGTAGDDTLTSPEEYADVRGFDGDDTFIGRGTDDNFFGGPGDDTLTGAGGADVLAGGAGNDHLFGGSGNDYYIYELGDGVDVIDDMGNKGGVDTLEFGEGIHPGQLIIRRDVDNPNDLVISIDGMSQHITIKNQEVDSSRIDVVYFRETGLQLPYSELPNDLAHIGTAGADLITGGANDDSLYGHEGNDVLKGEAGADKLFGGSGDDTLEGGQGNDTLTGGSGNDTYKYVLGDGGDTIEDNAPFGEYSFDTLEFGAGISSSDLIFSGLNTRDLLITVKDATVGDKTITLIGQFGGDISSQIEKIVFTDPGNDPIFHTQFRDLLVVNGTEGPDAALNGTNVAVGESLYGLGGDDVINAAGGNDALYGGSGSDTLKGSIGDDLLEGGTGNDTLDGGWGSDRYDVSLGDGNDTVEETAYPSLNAVDVVDFSEGITGSDISWTVNDTDLTIHYSSQDSVKVTGQLGTNDNLKIEQLRFADGSVVDKEYIAASTILGTASADSVTGTSNGDKILGFAGADEIAAGDGNDTILGGTGDDTLSGGAGDDIYLFEFGDGIDSIEDESSSATGDKIVLRAGITQDNLIITRDAGTSDLLIVYGGAGNSIRVVDHFNGHGLETIDFKEEGEPDIDLANIPTPMSATHGTISADVMTGTSSADVLYSHEGADQIELGDGDDTAYGGFGGDIIQGMDGDDTLYGESGSDSLYGGDGNDTLEGGLGADRLVGGAGSDTYVFNDGDQPDEILENNVGDIDSDYIDFRAGISKDDAVFSRVGKDAQDLQVGIRGTTNAITILGQFGSDISMRVEHFVFFDGTLSDPDGMPILEGGTEEDDELEGTAGADALDGFEGDDTISGLGGQDMLYGGEGDDVVDGGDGNDLLGGDEGDDLLMGGEGDDTYLFARDGGADTIEETDSSGTGDTDTIKFRAGIRPEDLNFRRSGVDDLLIEVMGSADSVTVKGYFGSDPGARIERIVFADDPTVITATYIQENLHILTSDGGDHIIGTDDPLGEELDAQSGDDYVFAGAGDDEVLGGDGNDVLDGGEGDDNLEGGAGSDTYVFTRGQGVDTVIETTALLVDPEVESDVDVVRFASDINPEDVRFSVSGNNLIISLLETDDQMILVNQFARFNSAGEDGGPAVEQFVYADGTTYFDLPPFQVNGTSANDSLNGSDMGDLMLGGDGNDTLNGGRRDDALYGEEGTDTLVGGSGDDVLVGGVDDDDLQGGAGNDTYVISLGDGSDNIVESQTAGEDGGVDTIELLGVAGAENVTLSRVNDNLVISFDGGAQSVTVEGQYSNAVWKHVEHLKLDDTTIDLPTSEAAGGPDDDVYEFGRGSGTVSLDEANATSPAAPGGIDTVEFGEGITAEDLVFLSDDNDLVISIFGTGDQLTIIDQYSTTSAARVERFVLSDDTVIREAPLHQMAGSGSAPETIIGTEGNDHILAGDVNQTTYPDEGKSADGKLGDDTVIGGSGDDEIFGGEGNDRLAGRTGDDTLSGGHGDDVYLFKSGDGVDHVTESKGSGVDTLLLGEGISEEDLSWVANAVEGSDVIVSIAGTNDQIVLKGHAGTDTANRIEYVRFFDGTIMDAVLLRTVLDDLLGTSGNDTLSGHGLGDPIYGLAGDDDLSGLGGDDLLYGGDGNDSLLGGIGDDGLFGDSGNDALEGQDGDDALDGGSGIDNLEGGEGNDELAGGTGADTLSGDAGDDTLEGGSEDDNLDGGEGNDALDGGSGEDTLLGGLGDDTLAGGDQDDSLDGGDGDDTLDGGSGVDTLIGGAGSDSLNGSAGNDTLKGGSGDDLYLFGPGGGSDVIVDSEPEGVDGGDDTLRLDETLALADLKFERQGDNLVIAVAETGDQIVVEGQFSQDPSKRIEHIEIGGVSYGFQYLSALFSIQGTASNDTLNGTDGDETIYGRAGNDTLLGSSGHDILVGGAGNDVLDGGAGNDNYRFGLESGQDIINEDSDSGIGGVFDSLELGEGLTLANVTFSQAGQDLIVSLDGTTDSVTVSDYFAAGSETVESIILDGTRFSRADIEQELSTVKGTDLDDELGGTAASQEVYGRAGNDELLGLGGDDTLFGDSGNDLLDGGEGDDRLLGGDGDDTLEGGVGADTLEGDVGEDDLSGGAGNDSLLGGEDDDVLGGGDDQDYLSGDEGADTLAGGAGDDTLLGGPGDDTLEGEAGADLLEGGEGADVLLGGDGADTLSGGLGNDTLTGGLGDDVYRFDLEYGTDEISDGTATVAGGGEDVVEFGSGLTLGDLSFSASGTDVIVSIEGYEDELILKNQLDDQSTARIELLRFGNGETLSADLLITGADIEGTSGNDTLVGTWSAESIYGYEGNDTITGGSLADTLYSGDGEDSLTGGDGADSLVGGPDNDTLTGGAGNDSYHLDIGDGQDTINENTSAGQTSVDTIRFAAGILPADVRFSGSGSQDLVITFGTGDTITVAGHFGTDAAKRIEQIEFEDEPSTVYTDAQINSMLTVEGTAGNDTLTGSDVAVGERIYGFAGNDTIHAAAGPDSIYGDAGDDTIYGEAGDDSVYGNGGNDTLYGGDGSDTVYGEDGNDSIVGMNGDDQLFGGSQNDTIAGDAGNDSLYGEAGDDILLGGPGVDSATGGSGSDTYLFNPGDGPLTITENLTVGEASVDTIRFGAGISPSAVTFQGSGTSDLLIKVGTSGDQILVVGHFGSDVARRIEYVTFVDSPGTIYTDAQISAMLTVTGTAGNDTLAGSDVPYTETISGLDGNDIITAGAGPDTVNGGNGNDDITGGAGSDALTGGSGTDTYRYNLGDGFDTITENTTVGQDSYDTIEFGAGITQSNIVITKNTSNDLIISINGATDMIKVAGHFSSDIAKRVELLKFSDGSQLGYTSFPSTLAIHGTVAADNIVGTSGGDIIYVYEGNDIVDAKGGQNVVYGGAGDDNIITGQSWDTIYGGPGNDTIDGGDMADDIYGEDGDDHLIGDSQGDMIDGGAGNDTIYGLGYDDDLYGGAGNDTLYGGSDTDRIYGGDGGDAIYGETSGDTIDGGKGNDFLDGANSSDTYTFALGDGIDTINDDGGTGNDSDAIQFASGITSSLLYFYKADGDNLVIENIKTHDQINVLDHFDTSVKKRIEDLQFSGGSSISHSTIPSLLSTYGGSSNDTLTGTTSNNTLVGLAGNDTINAGSGDDLLVGGTGGDTLNGEAGNDRYVFGVGDGSDTVSDSGGTLDNILFRDSVGQDAVALFMNGNNLQIGYTGSSDLVTVQNQSVSGSKVERMELSDGKYLTDADINSIIQQMAAYASSQGIAFNNISDVKGNENLMNIVSNTWHT